MRKCVQLKIKCKSFSLKTGINCFAIVVKVEILSLKNLPNMMYRLLKKTTACQMK